jgi:xanthine dehydrogenase accessory factor
VVADRSGLELGLGSRVAVPERSEPTGSLHPALDALVVSHARARLAEKRSGIGSYRLTASGAEYAGIQGGAVDIFFEVLSRPPRLIIVGAGHIAVPLAAMAKLLDFEVTVLDDRPEFATSARFPTADQLVVGPYRQTLATLPVDSDTYVVLVTRGHVHDQACLEQVLDSPAAYIGMIGSKRRVRTVMRHAKESGHDPARLAQVYAPIGLDIGSQTPAEIALAILAEIVRVRRGGRARSLALKERLHV